LYTNPVPFYDLQQEHRIGYWWWHYVMTSQSGKRLRHVKTQDFLIEWPTSTFRSQSALRGVARQNPAFRLLVHTAENVNKTRNFLIKWPWTTFRSTESPVLF
jgi:hypothetical protein